MDATFDALTDAAFRGDLEAVKALLVQGADINAEGRVWNPLHAAIENGQIEVIRYLIRAGADVEFDYSSTPLAHAVDLIIDSSHQNDWSIDRCSKHLIDMLMDAGAHVEPGLMMARSYHCPAVEEHLLRRAGLMPDLGATSIIAGNIYHPEAKGVAGILKGAGWAAGKAGGPQCEVQGEGFDLYLHSDDPVLAYGPADHPGEVVGKMAKVFDYAGVRYYFEVFDPAGTLKEIVTC